VNGPAAAPETRELDLRGVPCPLNWVRTRLALESLEAGEELVVRLDAGEPFDSVPRSALDDGHTVELEGERVRIWRR
jgi:TusA-related sulfurtransferase